MPGGVPGQDTLLLESRFRSRAHRRCGTSKMRGVRIRAERSNAASAAESDERLAKNTRPMSTLTIYPLRSHGSTVSTAAHSSIVRRLLVVLGLASMLVPLLATLFDLAVYQALPIAVLLGLTGQRLVELALSRHH